MATQLVVIGARGLLLDARGRPDPGGLEALARLTHAGFRVAVLLTSGSGKAAHDAGTALERLATLQAELQRQALEAGGAIDGFFVCSHPARSACACRPPRHGLFEEITARWRVEPAQLVCVHADADERRAARAVGTAPAAVGPDREHADLAAFVAHLLDERAR